MAPPPCEASQTGAGVGRVARDTVINALATIEAWAQDQAHRGCGHRKEPKPHATASRMWAGELHAVAVSPFPPSKDHSSDHDTGDGASSCPVSGSLSWSPGCLAGTFSRIISFLGSDSGFLWKQTLPESPIPIALFLSLILSISSIDTSGSSGVLSHPLDFLSWPLVITARGYHSMASQGSPETSAISQTRFYEVRPGS